LHQNFTINAVDQLPTDVLMRLRVDFHFLLSALPQPLNRQNKPPLPLHLILKHYQELGEVKTF